MTIPTKPTYAQTLLPYNNTKTTQHPNTHTPQQPVTYPENTNPETNPGNENQTNNPQIDTIPNPNLASMNQTKALQIDNIFATKLQNFLTEVLSIIDTTTNRNAAKTKICEIAQMFLDVDTHKTQ